MSEMNEQRGTQRDKHPLRANVMVRACRYQASLIRRGGGVVRRVDGDTITAAQAAADLEAQAERWEAEMRTGVPNVIDRAKLE